MRIIENDIEQIVQQFPGYPFMGKKVLITGGTGLIGKTLVPAMQRLGAQVLLIVRSEEKARKVYGDSCAYYVGTVENVPDIENDVDYIVHMASPTSSAFFVKNPVETIQIAVQGTNNLLELARKKQVDGFVYLSSMEVYGYPVKGHLITEDEVSGFDTRIVRNSYPLSKIACEMLCCAYANEYGVPVKVARLTQTFGPGVEYNDGRIFAEMMRCVIEKKNIILHTAGETERCYLYTADAVTAIITLLLKGKNGEVYNTANESTYCSIREMAELVAEIGDIKVQYEFDDIQRGYAATLFSKLDTSNLRSLGWLPKVNMRDMFERMISSQLEEI